MQSARYGFTLVELLVTISIIAVLGAVAFVFFNQAQISGRDSKRMGDLREAQKALEQYFALTRSYPAAAAPGNALLTSLTTIDSYFESGKVPSDPDSAASYPYRYWKCPTDQKYLICSKLESCNKNCNRTNWPSVVDGTPGCTAASDGTTPAAGFYCVSSLSN